MATIRAYTTIEQSRKLAEILPLESSDMYYLAKPDDTNSNMVASDICIPRRSENDGQAFGEACAWSLAALLNILPKYELYNFGDTIELSVNREALATEGDETLLDLVVNMIIYLHELNLLLL